MVSPVFFDTSVFIAGLINFGATSERPRFILNSLAEASGHFAHTAWHCCLEFYAVSTRLPEEARLTPAFALRLLEENILSRFQVHQLPDNSFQTFLSEVEALVNYVLRHMAVKTNPCSRQTFDHVYKLQT